MSIIVILKLGKEKITNLYQCDKIKIDRRIIVVCIFRCNSRFNIIDVLDIIDIILNLLEMMQ